MPGLPNTRVIPLGWDAHHRPVSADAMPDACTVTRPTSDPAWDDAAGRSIYPPSAEIYPVDGDGRCRITLGGTGTMPSGAVVAGDRAVTQSDYTVVLPTCTALIQVGDIVTVTCCPDDPDLVGQKLRVKNAIRGTYTWERILACELQPRTTR
jgi:hypothetical protein